MTAQHSPLPWNAQPTAGHNTHGQSAVYDEANGKTVAIVYDGAANAAFIVEACNSHEALLAACKAAQAALATSENRYLFGAAGVTVGQMLSEAIQAATEQPTNEPCPHCDRNEDGKWFVPCPSDDCPSHDQSAGGEP